MRNRSTVFSVLEVKHELRKAVSKERCEVLKRFFKTGAGEYGAGDLFLGVSVPEQRKLARRFFELPLTELSLLLKSKYHEDRSTALLILVLRYKNSDEKERLVRFYLQHLKYVNNWDLVDCSAYHILGAHYLISGEEEKLYRLGRSKNLWERRIAMVATFAYIRAGRFEPTLALVEILHKDGEDLIHKATGWMLREVGKRDTKTLERFLKMHARSLPRTTLRYAIERFSDSEKKLWMKCGKTKLINKSKA